jgi:hypothetical protein
MRDSGRPWKILALAAALAVLGLAACREGEVGRPLSLEKGTYKGAPDTPLDAATVEALRARTAGQRHSGL